jgi:hypothetical protein
LGMCMKAWHPKTRSPSTRGFSPVQASWGVIPQTALVGLLLRR